jgi:histidine triad (HIT) family protein
MKKFLTSHFIFYIAVLLLGILVGGFLFSKTQPRSFLNVTSCEKTCYTSKDLVGLLTSVDINALRGVLPSVVLETDKTIVIKHPLPQAKNHFVILPKKDMKNISDVTSEDLPYINDVVSVIGKLVREYKLVNYRVITNGPGYQQVTYLHFHLLGD